MFFGELYFKISNLYTVNGIILILSSWNYLINTTHTTVRAGEAFHNAIERLFCCYNLVNILGMIIIFFGHYIIGITLFVYKNTFKGHTLFIIYTIISSFNITRAISFIVDRIRQLPAKHFVI